MRFSDLIPILQTAIGPVILISGVGLLLLSMTNRFGRVIDRGRLIADRIRVTDQNARGGMQSQLQILWRRARLLRLAITLSIVSLLLAATLIIALFITALFQSDLGLPVIILFVACMSSLIGSLAVFIKDINLSLAAMHLEINAEEEIGA